MASRRSRSTRSTSSRSGANIARYLLPAAALAIGAYLLWPRIAKAAVLPTPGPAPGPPNPLPPAPLPRPLPAPAPFVPSARDRLADEGRALLNSAQNPATVTAAQLRAKAAELRRVNEGQLADMLDDTANRLPV